MCLPGKLGDRGRQATCRRSSSCSGTARWCARFRGCGSSRAPRSIGAFDTGYADMAIESWKVFERLQKAGDIPAGVKFQISIPTPIAPTYNNMVPADRQKLLAALTRHFIGEVAKIAKALPNDRIAIQWDVCQEVLAWEGYYDKGPVDFRTETIDVLTKIGDGVPAGIELGYHLCYGSPADEHMVLPKDMGIMVEMTNAIVAGVKRPIQFVHMPVVKARTDDAYYAPLKALKLSRRPSFISA